MVSWMQMSIDEMQEAEGGLVRQKRPMDIKGYLKDSS